MTENPTSRGGSRQEPPRPRPHLRNSCWLRGEGLPPCRKGRVGVPRAAQAPLRPLNPPAGSNFQSSCELKAER
eukprot:3065885-Pyramimonas_sp.AAC.2